MYQFRRLVVGRVQIRVMKVRASSEPSSPQIVLTNFVNAGHEEFSRRFDVDMETEMRGSVKPYRRQVSTGTNTRSLSKEF